MNCNAVNAVRVGVKGLVIFLIKLNITFGPSIKPGTLYVQYRLANWNRIIDWLRVVLSFVAVISVFNITLKMQSVLHLMQSVSPLVQSVSHLKQSVSHLMQSVSHLKISKMDYLIVDIYRTNLIYKNWTFTVKSQYNAAIHE